MCGIAGFWEPPGMRSPDESRRRLETMRDQLRHRGPDDQGVWLAPEHGVGLGHRRLAILDLSSSGHQPMASADQRFWIVYNGEIYNFLELRRDLEFMGHAFRGTSDTEVLLAAFRQWGLEASLARCNGMFALALWDDREKKMYLARDRFGKKPLYYGRVGEAWVFASELKALRALPDFSARVNRDNLSLFLRFGYVPAPHTIYDGIFKLPAGHFFRLDDPGGPRPLPPWACREDNLEQALLKSVQRRMLSDVPLGAFLSGGIDSSLIVALMQEVNPGRVRTFSLGFWDKSFDEAVYARRVAAHLGTEHHEHYLSPEQARSVIPMLPNMFDEPFADSSQIPTFLVSQLARTEVTVALSGDGGDELFGGYNRYLWGPSVWRVLSMVPLRLRRLMARLLNGLRIPGLPGISQDKLTKLTELLKLAEPRQLYKSLVSPWREPDSLVIGGQEPPTLIDQEPLKGSMAEWMMHFDRLTYLPDDILVKVDRASMAVSLEARAPFLDPEVAALASRLPLVSKIRSGQSKWILREMLYRRLPRELFERPKAGFALPLGSWLRHELREWAEGLLRPVSQQGFLRPERIEERWRQHLNGRRDWSASLWTVLMFQAWLGEQNVH